MSRYRSGEVYICLLVTFCLLMMTPGGVTGHADGTGTDQPEMTAQEDRYKGQGLTVAQISNSFQGIANHPGAAGAGLQQKRNPREGSLLQALMLGFAMQPGFNSFAGDGTDELDSKMGLDFSGYLMMPLFIQMELLREIYILGALSYLSRGAAYSFGEGNFSFEERITLSYLALWVAMRGSISVAQQFPVLTSIYFELGPKLGLLMRDRVKQTSQGQTHTGELGAKSINLGLALAIGGLMPLGPGFLDLGLQYELGLTSIPENENAADWRTTAFIVSVGYVISLSQLMSR